MDIDKMIVGTICLVGALMMVGLIVMGIIDKVQGC